MQRIKGIAVSHGIVVGRAFLVGTAEQVVPHRTIQESEVPQQLERLHVALRAAGAQIAELSERTRRELGTNCPADARTKIEGAVSNLEDKLKGDDQSAIEAALTNLTNAAGELQQAAQQAQAAAGAQGAAGASAGTGGGAKKDDVIDAEYEVNEDKKG